MHPPMRFTLEAHVTAAALYLNGPVTPDDAVRAFRHCYSLPARVRHLFVDLRRAYALDPGCLKTLEILLEEWRASRGRCARVIAPATQRRVDVRRLAPPPAPRAPSIPRASQHSPGAAAVALAAAP